MQTLSPRNVYWQGLRDALPFMLVTGPFGLVFGVVAAEAGLGLSQVMAFSMTVIAGAAQLTALQLMREGAPLVIVIVTALAVNTRMAMYSASLLPHLGAAPIWQRALIAWLMVDQAYASSILRYERAPVLTTAQKVAYYFGIVTPVLSAWVGGSLAGAVLGEAIPPQIPIAAAVPIAFMALIGPMLRTLAQATAALVSILGALVFSGLPYNLGLLVAALAAMASGALVEVWMERRRRA
jgi:predicted branched-subunit amino acid permease